MTFPPPNLAAVLPSDTLQKQDRTGIIYSKAITAENFICHKIERFGPIQFTWLGIERRDSKQPESFPPAPRVQILTPLDSLVCEI